MESTFENQIPVHDGVSNSFGASIISLYQINNFLTHPHHLSSRVPKFWYPPPWCPERSQSCSLPNYSHCCRGTVNYFVYWPDDGGRADDGGEARRRRGGRQLGDSSRPSAPPSGEGRTTAPLRTGQEGTGTPTGRPQGRPEERAMWRSLPRPLAVPSAVRAERWLLSTRRGSTPGIIRRFA